jgi:hypothetical protein
VPAVARDHLISSTAYPSLYCPFKARQDDMFWYQMAAQNDRAKADVVDLCNSSNLSRSYLCLKPHPWLPGPVA